MSDAPIRTKWDPAFVDYLRQFPTMQVSKRGEEIARMRAHPELQDHLAMKHPDDPHERELAIQQQAKINAKQLALQDLYVQQQKYGVKDFNPATLRAAYLSDRQDRYALDDKSLQLAQLRPGVDPIQEYRDKYAGADADKDLRKTQNWLMPADRTMNFEPEQISAGPRHHMPVVAQAPQPVSVQDGTTFTGAPPEAAPAGPEGQGAPAAQQSGQEGASRMYAPGTEVQ